MILYILYKDGEPMFGTRNSPKPRVYTRKADAIRHGERLGAERVAIVDYRYSGGGTRLVLDDIRLQTEGER